MQRGPDTVTVREVAAHFAMGTSLGTLAALLLLLLNGHVFEMIARASGPAVSPAFFVAVFASLLGVGATLTGVIFSAMEAERIAESKRPPPQRRT